MVFFGMLRKKPDNKNTIMPLYKFMFLPYLECYMKFWFSSSKNDAAELEKLQRRARWTIDLPYEKNELGVLSIKNHTNQEGSNIIQKLKVT